MAVFLHAGNKNKKLQTAIIPDNKRGKGVGKDTKGEIVILIKQLSQQKSGGGRGGEETNALTKTLTSFLFVVHSLASRASTVLWVSGTGDVSLAHNLKNITV